MKSSNYSSRPKSSSSHRKETTTRNRNETSANLGKKTELKSSIPKPVPFVRRSLSVTAPIKHRHQNRCCLSSDYITPSPIQRSNSPAFRNSPKDNLLLEKSKLPRMASEKIMRTQTRSLIPRSVNRPKSAGILRPQLQMNNQYTNVKAKVNSNLVRPLSPKVRPVSPKLSHPISSSAVRPVSPKLPRSASPNSVRPKSSYSVRPVSPNSVRSKSPTSFRPESPNSVCSQSPNLVRPQSPNSVHPESPNSARPKSPNSVCPESPNSVRLESTNSSRPESPNLAHPESQNSVHPKSPNAVRLESPMSYCSISPNTVPPVSPLHRTISPNSVRSESTKSRSTSPKQNSELNQANTNAILKSSIPSGSKTSICTDCVTANERATAVEQIQLSGENFVKKESHRTRIHNEMKGLQSIPEQQALELQVQPHVLEKPKSPCEQSNLLTEDSPDFLSEFEKQTEGILESHLRLICNIISHKMVTGNSSLSRLTLPDSVQDPRKEVYKFLSKMPTEGGTLLEKLQNIEEEVLKLKVGVMHKVTCLTKSYHDLKDEHWRLEKTQDHLHSELKEELELLAGENKKLDKKYVSTVEKYHQEKAKCETQENDKFLIRRDLVEVKKKITCLEGKCIEWESAMRKFQAECKAIETLVRNTNLTLDKESKHQRELVCRYNEAQKIINELNTSILKMNEEKGTLEKINETLHKEICGVRASLGGSSEERNLLIEELAEKSKKINDMESELNQIRTGTNNNSSSTVQKHEVSSVLAIDLQQRNTQIQELTKMLKDMEATLIEKSNLEESLRRQVKNLQLDHSSENEVLLKSQITDLQYIVKDLMSEKAELERIVAQKSLELDQRDLMMKQNLQVLQARDELIPLIQSKQSNHKECTERLRAVILNHEKTYVTQEEDFNTKGNMILDKVENLNKLLLHDPKMVEQELSFHQEKMAEVYSLLEQKEMEMMRLEHRVQTLQRLQEEKEKMEHEKEEKFAAIQKEFREAKERKANRPRGFFSMFIGQDG